MPNRQLVIVGDVLSTTVLTALIEEADRAHYKHVNEGGSLLDSNLSLARRIAALGEEYGEVCRELTYDNSGKPMDLYTELIQTANVAMTWAEFILRSQQPQNVRSEG